MPGLWSITTRAPNTVLTANIYNADNQAPVDNDVPLQHDDYSATLAQMKSVVDPGEDGTESQPTTTAGELERLRFAHKEQKGTPQWYSTPFGSMSDLFFGTFS